MNFAYGVIAIVGVLAAIILGFIAAAPDDIIEPRIIPVEEKPTVCTMQWEPMCGVDGETYGNLCMLDASNIKLDYEGECVVAEPEPEVVGEESIEQTMMEETMEEETMMEETMEEETMMEEEIEEQEAEPESEVEILPMSLTISIPDGVGIPGCEETNECYSPYEVSVAVGTTVTWSNDDVAAHTVTSGNFPEHDELFDSSVFLSGDTFEFTFSDAGTFDYYCFVHPWMAGIVNVN